MMELLNQLNEAGIRLYVADGKLRANVHGSKIPPELKSKVSANKDTLISLLSKNEKSDAHLAPDIATSDIPLSFVQRRLWFEDVLAQGAAHYTIQFSEFLEGEFQEPAFTRVLEMLIQRHQILRTCYHERRGECFQKILQKFHLPYALFDVREYDEEERESFCAKLMRSEKAKAFSLASELPLRIKIIRLSPQQSLCLITIHHIACDGWSVRILADELRVLYPAFMRGTPDVLPKLSLQYKDYARWQRSVAMDSVNEQQLEYWRIQLANIPLVHQLPLDFPRPEIQSHVGTGLKRVYRGEPVNSLRSICERHQVTPFMLLYAVFACLLYRFSGNSDIVVGTPVSGRVKKELEPLIGCFVNTLILRTQFETGETVLGLLEKNKQTILDAYDNQNTPYELLVETLAPPRDQRFSPLFQIVFAFQSFDNKSQPSELNVTQGEVNAQTTKIELASVKADLELHVLDKGDTIEINWVYCAALFKSETIESMLDSFDCLLMGVMDALTDRVSGTPHVSSLQSLSQGNLHALVRHEHQNDTNGEAFEYFHQSVEYFAQSTPDAVALCDLNERLTYKHLNSQANQLAWALKEKNIVAEDLVGVWMSRSVTTFVSVLAILKAGAAYLPLDGRAPVLRLQNILDQSACKLLLQDKSTAARAAFDITWRLDDPAVQTMICAQAEDNLSLRDGPAHPDNGAYSIFTSGTTGSPKGVLLSHRGLHNLGTALKKIFNVTNNSRILQFASLGFDAATWDMVMAFANGASLYVLSESQLDSVDRIAETIITQGITHATLPPALLSAFGAETLARYLPYLVVAGEALDPTLGQVWQKGRRFFNAYGPSETTVCATVARYTGESVTIGQSIVGQQCYVMDEEQQFLPTGAVGELCIGGVGVARGYLQQAGLTAEKFIPSPCALVQGERLYRTGDRVRRLPNGEFEFLGRLDTQVKVRGYRIEIEEIKIELMRHPGVADSAVLVHEDVNEQVFIAAFVANARGDVDALMPSLKHYLEQRLPHYMMPDCFVTVETLPLTANGKVDTAQLLSLIEPASTEYCAPEGEVEVALANLWQMLLKREMIGRYDNFFMCGGHSLLAMKLVSFVEQQFSVRLPVSAIFQASTIQSMSTRIVEAQHCGQVADEVVTSLNDLSTLPPIYCCLGVGLFPNALREFQQVCTQHYNLRVLQMLEQWLQERPALTVEVVAKRFSQHIMRNNANRPINVLGHSFGGSIAFETAKCLMANNIDTNLILIDSFFDYIDFSNADVNTQVNTLVGSDAASVKGTVIDTLIQRQLAMLRHYRPVGEHAGPVCVIFAKQGLCGESSACDEIKEKYEARFRGELQFYFVQGGHTTIFRSPNVEALAESVKHYLHKEKIGKSTEVIT